MDSESITDKYHKSKRFEYKISNSYQTIAMQFPSLTATTYHLLRRRCMKIDHCQIEYHPQVPFNATGTVRVEIHDTRLHLDATLQAEYTFPIISHIKLNFFSSSYFSTSEPIPWKANFFVQDTNINNGTTFCKMRAHLMLSSEKTSSQVTFKPPTVQLLSTNVGLEQIDYKHVSQGEIKLELCRTQSNREVNHNRLSHTGTRTLLAGQSFQDMIRYPTPRYSYSDDTHTDLDDTGCLNNISQHPTKNEDANRIVLTPTGLAKIITETTASISGSKPM